MDTQNGKCNTDPTISNRLHGRCVCCRARQSTVITCLRDHPTRGFLYRMGLAPHVLEPHDPQQNPPCVCLQDMTESTSIKHAHGQEHGRYILRGVNDDRI